MKLQLAEKFKKTEGKTNLLKAIIKMITGYAKSIKAIEVAKIISFSSISSSWFDN